MSTDKFYVYIINNSTNSIDRLFTDNVGIYNILREEHHSGQISVLRSVTNQCAVLIGEDVVAWVDIPEKSEIVGTRIF